MASIKKELNKIFERFDAAQEAFADGAAKNKKNKRKLKSAKAKIQSLEQKVASLEQQLKVAKGSSATDSDTSAKSSSKSGKKNKSKKKTDSRRAKTGVASRATSSADTKPKKKRGRPTNAERAARAAASMDENVSAAAAETPASSTPLSSSSDRAQSRDNQASVTGAGTSSQRPTRPSKMTTGKAGRKSGPTKPGASSDDQPRTKRRRGRPSTKPAPHPLTAIAGVGPAMAKKFSEAGVETVEEFSKLDDDRMGAILQECGPRYRNSDAQKMEGYREAARAAM